jgi:hypothetical protein
MCRGVSHDLIDAYRLQTYPAALGKGRRACSLSAALRLVDNRTTGSGVTISVYQPAATHLPDVRGVGHRGNHRPV